MNKVRDDLPLVVTENGVPFKDQAEGLAKFKAACLAERPQYNERYSRPIQIKLGDLHRLAMSLGAAEDHLMWLEYLSGLTLPTSTTGVRRDVHFARDLVLRLLDDPPPQQTGGSAANPEANAK
jgi:hypothetical protein